MTFLIVILAIWCALCEFAKNTNKHIEKNQMNKLSYLIS